MMYDHSSKAGNKGDVWKHFALATVVDRLPSSDTFRYVDTHCGAPQHELRAGGEWEDGVGKVLDGCAALRRHGYIEVASRWVEGGLYPSSWRFAVECAASRFGRMEVHLSDTVRTVAARYKDLTALGLPGNVSVDFHAGDGFARLESTREVDLVLIDPPFSPDAGADWSRVEQACGLLKARGTRFLAWYPIFSDIEPAILVAATGCSASEVVWAPTVPGLNQGMAGCGILASRDCGDMLAACVAQLESLASCLGGKFRRWAQGL